MRKFYRQILIILMALWLAGCGTDEAGTPTPTYQELVDVGWILFTAGNYNDAITSFQLAQQTDDSQAEAYSGIGWSRMQLDELSIAATSFSNGAGRTNPDATLFAGWAFVLHGQESFSSSNAQADEALALDTNWDFQHGLNLDQRHLHLLRAENFFALGNFISSLSEVQILNPIFAADVGTSDGQAALADEIERLRTTL